MLTGGPFLPSEPSSARSDFEVIATVLANSRLCRSDTRCAGGRFADAAGAGFVVALLCIPVGVSGAVLLLPAQTADTDRETPSALKPSRYAALITLNTVTVSGG